MFQEQKWRVPMDDLRLLSLSQARHDLQLFPRQFEGNPYPILVEQYGKPVMAIVPIELYAVMEGAMDYIEEKGLQPFFEEWLTEVDAELSNSINMLDIEEEAPADESDALALFREEGLLGNSEFRVMLKARFRKALAELEVYEQSGS